MRSLILSTLIGLSALVALAATPAESNADFFRRYYGPTYTSYYEPYYYSPYYYAPPTVTYYYSPMYTPSYYSAPVYSYPTYRDPSSWTYSYYPSYGSVYYRGGWGGPWYVIY
jgi:hypothetical protein